MKEIEKPVFTQAELDEIEKGRISIGYRTPAGTIMPGPNFEEKPFASKISKQFAAAKEKVNGIAKKRQYHEAINEFGWARLDNWARYPEPNQAQLMFGIKFSTNGGLTKTGRSVIKKYNKFLRYCLQQAGWEGIRVQKSLDEDVPDYIVPLNSIKNIKLLYTLSPSIGFYYKSDRPDFEALKNLEFAYNYEQQRSMQSKSKSR